MNMYRPALDDIDSDSERSLFHRLGSTLYALRYFGLVVLAPTLIVAGYLYAIAADQYQSEAQFVVSDATNHTSGVGGLGALVGLGSAASSQTQTLGVPDYLRSHEAVAAVQRSLPLVSIFRRPEADVVSRLGKSDPTPEQLLRYFRGKVKLTTDRDSGITELAVRAFRPDDAYALNRTLLTLGERQVNAMNARRYRDAVETAEMDVQAAEQNSAEVQRRITVYRQGQNDVDPQTSGEVQIKFMADLRARIVEATSQLETMRGLINATSPQYIALEHRVASLRSQLADQTARLAGSKGNIAQSLGGYEELKVRQDFAAKRYSAAAASLEKAREDAQRQQLYLVRIVDTNRPVEALYPERGKIVLTCFLALILTYGIGWLVLAGVKEHAA